jgi:hypothetical protein
VNDTGANNMSKFYRNRISFTDIQNRGRQLQAETARLMTACTIPTVSLTDCQYDKRRGVLKLASNLVGMPRSLFIQSHVTGKVVRFTTVGPEDVLFDQDGWDGEMQIYRPVGGHANVDHLCIYNS